MSSIDRISQCRADPEYGQHRLNELDAGVRIVMG
jgi:hypothetical protein